MKERIYGHMMKYKLHTRLVFYFLTMVIVSMVLVGSIAYLGAYRIVEDLAYSFSRQSVESVANNLNDIFHEAENLAGLVESNSVFQNILLTEMPTNIREQYSTELEYDYELYKITDHTVNQYAGFYVLGNNGYCFKSHNVAFQNKDFREEEWYRQALEADGFIWFEPQYYSRVVKSIDNQYAAMGYPIINRADGERIGIVLVEVDRGVIEGTIHEYGNMEFGVIQVLGVGDHILLSKDKVETGSVSERMKNKSRSVFYYTETLNNGWVLEAYISKKILLGRVINLGLVLLAIVFIMILIAAKVTNMISGTVTNPIGKLIELMEEAERHEFNVQMNVKYKDEVAVLGNKFNNMMEFTRHLIAVNNQEQENLREAELKTLQMQINPHFLYNTLETVIWLIRSGDNAKAISAVTSLSKFFRIGLSRGKNVITLREELEHVKEYMKIQNIRYRNKIEFLIFLEDESILNQEIPKLILQPIVENAIYHGIQEKLEGGSIKIKIEKRDNKIININVTDNGIGMTDIQLERLRMGLESKESAGFGMYNTNQRLKKFFGKDFCLKIESEFGEGTIVEFDIPCSVEGGEGYDKNDDCR